MNRREPSRATVEQHIARRRRMSLVEWVESTVFMAQTWPLLLMRVREREVEYAQQLKKRRRLAGVADADEPAVGGDRGKFPPGAGGPGDGDGGGGGGNA